MDSYMEYMVKRPISTADKLKRVAFIVMIAICVAGWFLFSPIQIISYGFFIVAFVLIVLYFYFILPFVQRN